MAAALVQEVSGSGAVHAAGGCVDEAPDADGSRLLGQRHRSQVVDPVRDLGLVLAERVVGQLGQVRDRIATVEILLGDLAQILVECLWAKGVVPVVAVEPAVAVVAGVERQDRKAALDQVGSQYGPDVSIDPGNEDFHLPLFLCPEWQVVRWFAIVAILFCLHAELKCRAAWGRVRTALCLCYFRPPDDRCRSSMACAESTLFRQGSCIRIGSGIGGSQRTCHPSPPLAFNDKFRRR